MRSEDHDEGVEGYRKNDDRDRRRKQRRMKRWEHGS